MKVEIKNSGINHYTLFGKKRSLKVRFKRT